MSLLTSFGVSVTGPGHLRANLPNQDSWRHVRLTTGTVIVVADGLGSKPFSAQGSEAACCAVPEALRIWTRNRQTPIEVLLGLIHLIWRARLGPIDPQNAATTCLFAYTESDGSSLIGQLGDGLALIKEKGVVSTLTQRNSDDFTNETLALGVTKKIKAWVTKAYPPRDRQIILCTDGISEDLESEKYSEFFAWLEVELAPLPPAQRWRELGRELRNWPTPHHIDDKTLAYLEGKA